MDASRSATAKGRFAGAALAVITAIVVTTALDANGLSQFSALPLLPLTLACWALTRDSRRAVGLAWGRPRDYAFAIAHPLLVIGLLAAIAIAAGAARPGDADWGMAARNFAIMAGATIPVALLTEEGFFRGWLPASLRGAGLDDRRVLIASSLAFSAWHVSAVTLDTGFDLPLSRVPVFLVNAAVLGAIWGAFRLASGSIVVASVAHGLWNGGAYVLFGFGPKAGALGIDDGPLYGAESGWLGLLLNFALLAWLVGPRGGFFRRIDVVGG